MIKYRKLDGDATAKSSAVNLALQAEHRAYQHECELERLRAVGATAEQTSEQRREARHFRKLAIGAVARAKVPRAALSDLRRSFVGDWLEKIEGDYVALHVQAEDLQAALAAKGSAALDADSRERLETQLEQTASTIVELEKVHAVAAKRWDALQGKTSKAKAKAPTSEPPEADAEEPPAD